MSQRHPFIPIAAFLLLIQSIAVAQEAAPPLSVDINFEGASARIIGIDQQSRTISFEPGGDAKEGWPCWWSMRVTGLRPGQMFTLRARASGDLLQTGARKGKSLGGDWAFPERAAYSIDGETWEQTSPGHRDGEWMVWTLAVQKEAAWVAWGPPYTPARATDFVKRCAKDLSSLCEAKVLCQSRQDRAVPMLRIAEGDRATGQRIGIWIQARQHAWESGSSWVAQGLAEWLLGKDAEAAWLRQHAEIFLVPVMDVDHVAAGHGGKEAVPQDHNRDWTDQPHWPEVRAAQQAMLALTREGRLAVYLDLHNPGPSDKQVHYHVPPDDYITPGQIAATARFADLARPHVTKQMQQAAKLNKSGANYDKLWQAMSACWVAKHGQPDTLAICAETPWNLPNSNQAGYRNMGAAYGKAVHDYLQKQQ